jgi:plastocyanin
MRKPLVLTAVLAVAVAAFAAPVVNAAKTPPPLAVTVKDNVFSPKKKTVKAGTKVTWTKVTWTWKGLEDHNVTLVTAPKGIKTAKYTSKTQGKGKTFVRTLSSPGKWFFVCTLHAGMEQTITVTK